jgi:hypothetical protein
MSVLESNIKKQNINYNKTKQNKKKDEIQHENNKT